MAPVRYAGPERRRSDNFDRWLARCGSVAMLILFAWAVFAATTSGSKAKQITESIRATQQAQVKASTEGRATNRIHVCYSFLDQLAIEHDLFGIARQAGMDLTSLRPSLGIPRDTLEACRRSGISVPDGVRVLPDGKGNAKS